MLFTAVSCAAQPTPDELVPGGDNVLVGAGVLPGLGLQAVYIAAGRMYTREALLLGNVIPQRVDGSLHAAAAIGAAVRIVGSLETLGMARPRAYDIHVGIRLGPGLRFGFDEDRSDRNQRFSLLFEPFVRYTRHWRRMVYVEAGGARPTIRAGVKI